MNYPVVIRPDTLTDGAFCYVAEHPDLPGCVAHGYSLGEAKENLAHAREAYLQHLRATSRPIPPPSTNVPDSVTWDASETEPAVIGLEEGNSVAHTLSTTIAVAA